MVSFSRKGIARRSRNQRSADSLVRVLLGRCVELADKAVRAPGKSSQNATMSGDGTAENNCKPFSAPVSDRRWALGLNFIFMFSVIAAITGWLTI